MVVDVSNSTGIINEISLYSSAQEHISIHCDPDVHRGLGFFMDPYIKVCDSPNWPNAENSVRIHLNDMGVNYSHSDAKGDLIVNKRLCNLLNSIMDRYCDAAPKSNLFNEKKKAREKLTVREAIIDFIVYLGSQSGITPSIGVNSVFDFNLCHVRNGKESRHGQRKKLDL